MPTHASHDPTAAFPGFARLQREAGGVAFDGVIGGSGPPLLLLHGFPQTHLAWRLVAPRLAETFTVIAPDLPGYGGSRIRHDGPRWSKRRVGAALAELMTQLGHVRFAIAGHDRGARAGYRLALDHPQQVSHYASLTVVPTQDAWDATDMRHGLGNFHWFLLAQPFDLPERLLSADPDAFIEAVLARMAGGLEQIDAAALAAYTAAFRDPAVRHAICEDYRAATQEDLEHDAADRAAGIRLQCPVLVLWPQAHAATPSPLTVWRRWADDVSGKAISGGHLQPEQSAHEVLAQLLAFLTRR